MAVLSLSDILRQEILDQLEGSESILVKTILDLTPRVKKGSDRVQIPYVSGLALSNVTPGTIATAGGMTTTGSTLVMDQVKQVPEYIDYDDNLDSALDLKEAFLAAAPAIFAQGIEAAIATKLATTSDNDFDSNSAVAGTFAIDDWANAKKLMDRAGVPKSDRWAAVNADSMELLASFSEFEDGSKSLSDEALRMGAVSQVKGFKVVQSEDVGSTTAANNVVHFYHRSAIAFALHDGVRFIEQVQEDYGREFIALRGKYGVIDCDNTDGAGGDRKRKITMALTTATS